MLLVEMTRAFTQEDHKYYNMCDAGVALFQEPSKVGSLCGADSNRQRKVSLALASGAILTCTLPGFPSPNFYYYTLIDQIQGV